MTGPSLSIRRPVVTGLLALLALVGGIGGWSATTPIAGAIVAPARLVVDGNRRPVQHPEGGVVEAVFVREGDRVPAGARLMTLDGRLYRTERAVITTRLAETAARIARLVAERDGAASMQPPARPAFSEDEAAALDGERRLFEARRAALEGQVSQFAERARQAEAEIAGTAARVAALRAERGFLAEDTAAQETLFEAGLTPRARVTALRRDTARIDGDLGELAARTARLHAEIAETRLAMISLADDRRQTALADLREATAVEAELRQRALSIDETLDRLDVRAPVAGVVLGLRVSAAGAVIRPADVILDLVPEGERLLVEARIGVTDIDAVRPGQSARLRFAAFDRRTTPDIAARVARVSPDIVVDEATGVAFYTAELRPDPDALDLLGDLALVPGMPVDAYLLTGERTALAYLLGPLGDYFFAAFREG